MSASSPHHCGLDGDRQAAGDRRRTCLQAGAQRRMAAGRLSCFARNGRSPGEESRPAPLRHRRSRRSRPVARSAHRRGRMERSISREDQGEPGDSIVQPRRPAASAHGAHPASRRPAASMLPMSRDRRATSLLPTRAWSFVGAGQSRDRRCPRPMGSAQSGAYSPPNCQQARKRSQAA